MCTAGVSILIEKATCKTSGTFLLHMSAILLGANDSFICLIFDVN